MLAHSWAKGQGTSGHWDFSPPSLRGAGSGLCSPPAAPQALSLPLAASLCLDVIPVTAGTPGPGSGPWDEQQDPGRARGALRDCHCHCPIQVP